MVLLCVGFLFVFFVFLEREKSEIAEQRGRSEAGRRAAEERAERAEEKCRNLEEKLEYVEIR